MRWNPHPSFGARQRLETTAHHAFSSTRRIMPAPSPIRIRGALLRVLGLAIAKRPVLLLHLHEADQGVLATKPNSFVESVGQCPIEGSLDVDASSLIECHLDQDRFLAPPNAETGGVDHEFAL